MKFAQETLKYQVKLRASIHSRRRIFAWLLLLVLCLQRILGLVERQLVHTIEVEAGMNTTEKIIAEKIKDKTGLEAHISIQNEQQLDLLQTQGYTAPFIFSEELDGKTCYYTIDYASTDLIRYSYAVEKSSDPLQYPDADRFFKEGVLSKFFFSKYNPFQIALTTSKTPGNTIPHFEEDFFISIPSPPPELS